MNHIGWLEPLLPGEGRYPPSLLKAAEQLPYRAGLLRGLLPAETATRLGSLLRITNTYYTNLIEGQHTEVVTLAANAKRKTASELRLLSIEHMHAQAGLERMVETIRDHLGWEDMLSPKLVERVHKRLFKDAAAHELTLDDESEMIPGETRAVCGRMVHVGGHLAPAPTVVPRMMQRMQEVYGRLPDQRGRIVSAMAFHHRLAFVHPFPDGNGRIVRLLTHLQLHYLGLSAPLWSLSRGLARRQREYYSRLAAADQSRRGDMDGRGQLSEAGLCEFIEFMLDTCIDQMQYIQDMIDIRKLRDRMERAVVYTDRVREAGVKPECAKALHILFTQGEVARSDFKQFTGLGSRTATEQMAKLVSLGLVDAPSPKSRIVHPGLPIWWAHEIFPDLHRRFQFG